MRSKAVTSAGVRSVFPNAILSIRSGRSSSASLLELFGRLLSSPEALSWLIEEDGMVVRGKASCRETAADKTARWFVLPNKVETIDRLFAFVHGDSR